ncbi:tRNA (adenosine(37)-N6)-threonylcarbamoyltransferase complex ATPase subunit type 1 TsaE [Rubrobacter indicoceani]|uniref:tRNA (adenosine(37)-N6)-threonylcarbamoyltransferase complex ATPase subunit type 1 TsaE n=1 Tax=Rubrobacter indicoceani TaxID=2051957 RepID=UPI000E5C3AEE|nr:tRNA (adenosine(37)-N6)-threonylcarbamoyltransferase complex ATPase subunit type 1 TsaE [Rubrobacter indicoceani]
MATLQPDTLTRPELEGFAAELARHLRPGDVVVLSGEVGAGKTTFTRAACAALGVRERVTSPTYQLARSYKGCVGGLRVTVNHLDLYRLEGVGVEDALELDEYLTAGSITFIEWAEPAEGVIRNPSRIFFEHVSEDTRGVSVEGPLAARLGTDGC